MASTGAFAEMEPDVIASLRDHVLSMPEWLLRERNGGIGCDYSIGILLDREQNERLAFSRPGPMPAVWETPVRPRLTFATPTESPMALDFRRQVWHAMTPNAWISFCASYIVPPRGVKFDYTRGFWTVGFAFYEQGN